MSGQRVVGAYLVPRPVMVYPDLSIKEQEWVRDQMALCEGQAHFQVVVVGAAQLRVIDREAV